MKILVLDEEFPYPLNSGKRTRSFNLYRRLAGKFDITYLGYGEDRSVAAEAMAAAGIEPVAVPGKIARKHGILFYMRLLANLFSPLPYIVTSHYSKKYLKVIRNTIVRCKPDLVLFEWTPYAIYMKDVHEANEVPKIISTHNIESDIWQRYYENESSLTRRWYIERQWRKVERFERGALTWIEGAFAVSNQDGLCLQKWCPGLSVMVVPNGVDLDYFQPLSQPADGQQLVFTGSMDWRPNQDAAHFFVREIFPLLRQVRPAIECTFVGRNPPVDIQALAAVPGVRVTGTVEDVRPYVARASVYVVPLRIGGGSRLKILEAMAMNRAVVSTTVGAEGLDVEHDRNLLLADDPRDFAQSILRLLDDPQKCLNLGLAGRHLVEQHYGWDALADRFGEFLRNVAEKGTTPNGSRVSTANCISY